MTLPRNIGALEVSQLVSLLVDVSVPLSDFTQFFLFVLERRRNEPVQQSIAGSFSCFSVCAFFFFFRRALCLISRLSIVSDYRPAWV
jgi:hypothetical protein